MRNYLVCLMIMLCLFCTHVIAETDGLYTYQINEDNTVTITGFNWKNNHGDIYIPEMLGNRIVSSIGEKAFATKGNTAVKITLPDGIRSIGPQAFRGVSITYVNIPINTVEIGGGAFAQCSVMRFNVANGHTVFATIDNSLYNKQTKTLLAWPENKDISAIPNGIIHIGDYAFYGRSFSTSNKKTENLFSFSTSNKKELYTLPATIETIGEYAFARVTGLSLSASGVKTIGAHAFDEAELELQSNSVSVIGDYAFYKAIVEFKSTLSLSKIGKHAFQNSEFVIYESERNENLLSKTPYEIGEFAFSHSRGSILSRVNLVLKNVTSIGARAFDGITQDADLALRLNEGDLENLTYLGENAFYDTNVANWGNDEIGYHSYVDLTNPSMTSVPKGAFYYTWITDLKIGPTVSEIGEGAFERCENLQKVELTDGLLTINDKAFKGCKKLTAISIPASVTMMGNDIFTGCADTFVVTVEAGSYGELWARTCGYSYIVNGQVEDTSWLLDE